MSVRSLLVSLLSGLAVASSVAAAEPKRVEEGTAEFVPLEGPERLPEEYRLDRYRFTYQLKQKYDLPNSGVEVYQLSFPSPVESPYPENNTVYAEYYRPKGAGPYPGVIILDVLAGKQQLARGMGLFLAQHRIAGLFVQMAYYGPRRPRQGRVRLLSTDFERTIRGIQQTVLDCRVASAWLAQRQEIDAKRLGMVGTSLGSFLTALTGAMEPRLGRIALLLSGGGLVDAYYDHPRARFFREINAWLGGTKEWLIRAIAPVDPLTYANRLKQRNLLMIAGRRDAIVPSQAAHALWQATGRQKIVWFDTGHYGAVLYVIPSMYHVLEHFGYQPNHAKRGSTDR